VSKILVVDDEHAICQAFSKVLQLEGHTPLVASNGNEALELARSERPEVVFMDIQMPGTDGLATLEQLQAEHPDIPVIIMTAYGTVDTAMKAMHLGAFDYLGKPVELPQIRNLLTRALHKPESSAEKPSLTSPSSPPAEQDALVGQSAPMQEVFKLMGLLTRNDLTVLITGESGVGKELVAKGIHKHSRSREQPFIAINCAAIPEQLLESELFGHEKGAFTGASERRMGHCETAGEGTLFLDEISELPYPLQGKLLRVLQERSFERVGSSLSIPLRARVIVASNRNLEQEVEAGRFREDLYHRLNLVTLRIPPLRTREDDIKLLAHHFLQQANIELHKTLQGIENEALEQLRQYSWPGNVRELEHVIKRSALQARGQVLTRHDLDLKCDETSLADNSSASEEAAYTHLGAAARSALSQLCKESGQQNQHAAPFHHLVSFVEQELIDEALRLSQDNQVTASKLLGLHRSTLRKKMRNN